MHAVMNKKTESDKFDIFFNSRTYKRINKISSKSSKKTSEKNRLQKINEELPDHCFQLLFLS